MGNLLELCKSLFSCNYSVLFSDCSTGIEFSIPGFGIGKFAILGSRFGIGFLDWLSFWYPQLTYYLCQGGNVFARLCLFVCVPAR